MNIELQDFENKNRLLKPSHIWLNFYILNWKCASLRDPCIWDTAVYASKNVNVPVIIQVLPVLLEVDMQFNTNLEHSITFFTLAIKGSRLAFFMYCYYLFVLQIETQELKVKLHAPPTECFPFLRWEFLRSGPWQCGHQFEGLVQCRESQVGGWTVPIDGR